MILVLLVPLGFTLVGLYLLSYGMYSLIQTLRSRSWPSVEGVIRGSELKIKDPSEPTYKPAVKYSYLPTEAFHHHLGTRIFFGDGVTTGWKKPAQERVNKYSVGSTINVFYDPMRPYISVLERSYGRAIILMIESAPILLIAGSILLTNIF